MLFMQKISSNRFKATKSKYFAKMVCFVNHFLLPENLQNEVIVSNQSSEWFSSLLQSKGPATLDTPVPNVSKKRKEKNAGQHMV